MDYLTIIVDRRGIRSRVTYATRESWAPKTPLTGGGHRDWTETPRGQARGRGNGARNTANENATSLESMIQYSLYRMAVPTKTSARLEALARLGRALADPTRCRLLLALAEGPAHPSELSTRLGLGRANTSNHLACLRNCGLVVAEPHGRQVTYELADSVLARALRDLADLVLAVELSAPCLSDPIRKTEPGF